MSNEGVAGCDHLLAQVAGRMPNPVRVLVCNTYALFREGIKALFRDASSIEIVGEAETAAAAIEMASRLNPDVVLMDLVLPDLSGFEATRLIKEINPSIKVLILTVYDDEKLIGRCLDAGASGYVLKDAQTSQLADAIDTVDKGGEYHSPKAA